MHTSEETSVAQARAKTSDRPGREGFTLVEFISVLVLLGILSATLYSKMAQSGLGNVVVTEGEILKQNLRYTQIQAMNSIASNSWRLTFAADGASYSLQQFEAATDAWQDRFLPAGATDTNNDGVMESHALAAPVTKISGPDTILFNSWGIPMLADRVTPVSANQLISLGYGTDSRSITVTKNTGYIP